MRFKLNRRHFDAAQRSRWYRAVSGAVGWVIKAGNGAQTLRPSARMGEAVAASSLVHVNYIAPEVNGGSRTNGAGACRSGKPMPWMNGAARGLGLAKLLHLSQILATER
jgi:hypothetical protein